MDTTKNENEMLGCIGNTRNTPTQHFKLRGKYFLLTLNQVDKWEELKNALVCFSTLLYIVASKEKAPTTGHEHIHVFLRFKQDKTLWAWKLFNVNMVLCDYPDKAVEYVKKDGDIIYEEGQNRHQGGLAGLTIAEAEKMDIEELKRILPLNYYNIIERMKTKRTKIKVKDTKKDVKIVYIYGDSGSGKSLNGLKLMEDLGIEEYDPVKCDGKFWAFTSGEGVALYDDFRDSHMRASEFINFIDYNKHPMRILNGNVINEYKTIIITSIQSPYDIYEKKTMEYKIQWLRRIKIYHVDENEMLGCIGNTPIKLL